MVDHLEAQNIGYEEEKGNFRTSIREFPDPPQTLFLPVVGQWISESARGVEEARAKEKDLR